MMVAIYEANPAAFGGNINVLLANSEIRIPAGGDVAAISASAAADEVARQYRQWSEGGTTAAAPAEAGGRLRLVTPEQGAAASAPATAAPAAAAPAADAELQDRLQRLEASWPRRAGCSSTQRRTRDPAGSRTGPEPGAVVEPAAPASRCPMRCRRKARPSPRGRRTRGGGPHRSLNASGPGGSPRTDPARAPAGLLVGTARPARCRARRGDLVATASVTAAGGHSRGGARAPVLRRPSLASGRGPRTPESNILVEERRPTEPAAAPVAAASVETARRPPRWRTRCRATAP